MEPLMHELFADPVGLMSLATIVGVLVIGAVIFVVVRRKIGEGGR